MRQPYHPTREELSLTSVLYALSDPLRLDIVRKLALEGEIGMQSCDAKVAKSTLSHHFKTLREAGLIHTRIEGTQRFVSLRKQDVDARFPGLLDVLISLQST
jgi:DNA-binding transcriptional ArsR family regulator